MSYEEEHESASVDDLSAEELAAGLDEDIDARFDAILRHEFDRAFPVLDQSLQVLVDLRPAVVRARRRRVAAQGAGWMSAACLVLITGVVALRPLAPSGGETVVAGPTEIVADSTPTPFVSLPTPSDASSDGAGPATTAEELEPVQPSSSTPSATNGETTMVTGLSASTIQEPTASPPASTATTAAQPTTTVNGTTSIPGSMRLEAEDCGAITFLAEDGLLELLGTEILGADREDIKSSGPNKIEVSFEGGGYHCELEAKFVDGRLQTSIENE